MPIHDFTNDFKAKLDWSRGGRRFIAQFKEEIRTATKGVYILVASNDSTADVVDRNNHQKPGGRINIPAGGMVVKFGKYEGGIALREHTNHKHWHRKINGAEESGIFPSCIDMLLVASFPEDRTDLVPKDEERALKVAVRTLLEQKEWSDPHQANIHPKMEARWIPANHRAQENKIKDALRALFTDLAKNRRW
jgi:hypothetical protein